MRDPARIDRITLLLNQVWKKYPDLRFFQLMTMIIDWDGIQDLFYLEDDKLEKKLLIEIEKEV